MARSQKAKTNTSTVSKKTKQTKATATKKQDTETKTHVEPEAKDVIESKQDEAGTLENEQIKNEKTIIRTKAPSNKDTKTTTASVKKQPPVLEPVFIVEKQ